MPIEMSSWREPLDATRYSALLVEDDPQLQRAMGRELARLGFRVLVAGHYDAAVVHLAAGEPRIACIDVGLPSKSGYDLCAHIRDSLGLAGLQIIMTSDYGTAEDKAFAEEAGANAFLGKPFSMAQLTQCVASLSKVSRRSVTLAAERHAVAWQACADRQFSNRGLELAGIIAA